MTEEVNKSNRGRPTKYDPSMCDKLLEMKKKGYTDARVCAEFNIARETFYDWLKKFPEFSDTNSLAREHCQAHEEKYAKDNIDNKNFKDGLWWKLMCLRYPKEYRDTKNVRVEGKLDGDHTVKHEGLKEVDLSALNVKQLEALKDITETLEENSEEEEI